MSIQEIIFICPKVSGVYMLGELQHRYSKGGWSCTFLYYVGQSADVAYRLMAHRNDRFSGFADPRMLLLVETRLQDRLKRLTLESNFLVAAKQLQLPLTNRPVANDRCALPFFEEEKKILAKAVLAFSGLAKTAWKHRGKQPCSFVVAA